MKPLEIFSIKNPKSLICTSYSFPLNGIRLNDLVKYYDKNPKEVFLERHIVWIWNRLLEAIDFASTCNLSIYRDYIYIYPKEHGVILLEWGFCLDPNKPIIYRSGSAIYPGSVKKGYIANKGIDIYMIANEIATCGLVKKFNPQILSVIKYCYTQKNNTLVPRDVMLNLSNQSIKAFGQKKFIPLEIKGI